MTDHNGFVDLGHTVDDGVVLQWGPTITVEVADWIAPLLGARILTGGVVDGDMVRFDWADGAVWIRRDTLTLGGPDAAPSFSGPGRRDGPPEGDRHPTWPASNPRSTT